MDPKNSIRKRVWTDEHTNLIHTLLDRGEIDPENTGKRHLQRIFDSYPVFATFQEGNRYRIFRSHLQQIISERIIQSTKNGKRRKGEFPCVTITFKTLNIVISHHFFRFIRRKCNRHRRKKSTNWRQNDSFVHKRRRQRYRSWLRGRRRRRRRRTRGSRRKPGIPRRCRRSKITTCIRNTSRKYYGWTNDSKEDHVQIICEG